MNGNIFKCKKMERLYDEQGFLIIKDFLNQSQLNRLDWLFADEKIEEYIDYSFFATTFIKDIPYRKMISRAVYNIHDESFTKVFKDYKSVCSNFIVKLPEEDSDLYIHQDTSFTDEKNHQTINVWSPLIDVNETNGTLRLIPGSQHYYEAIRAATIPYPFEAIRGEVYQELIPINISRGDALLIDPAIFHQSDNNKSGDIRIVSDSSICHKDTRFFSYYRDEDDNSGQIEIYNQKDDFLLEYKNLREDVFVRPPLGSFLKKINYNPKAIDEEEFKKLYQKHSIDYTEEKLELRIYEE